MLEKQSKPKAKDVRKRMRIAVNFTPDEMADIVRQIPEGQRATYCRNAILFPLRSPDPVIEVGARLLAMAATMKRLDGLTDQLKDRLAADLDHARGAAEVGKDLMLGLLARSMYNHLSKLLAQATSASRELLEEAALMRRLITEREERRNAIPIIGKRPKR